MNEPGSLIDIAGVLGGSLITAALLIWVERRMLAFWQERLGPNRVGPFGILQVVADMIKLFAKDEWVPPFADRPVFVIAPTLLMLTTLLGLALIPFAPGVGVVDLDFSLLALLALISLSVYGPLLAGYASNSKYALLGGLRAAAQTFSYEVFMGLAAMGVVMQADSFGLRAIVDAQQHGWYIVPQCLGFVLFFIATVAESRRAPLDLAEAEQELVAGFHLEYSGIKFGMFFVGEYIGIVLNSALLVSLYLGGWWGPNFLPPLAWFLLKTAVFVGLFLLLRASLPRPRYDQLMRFGWLGLLPLALLNLVLTAAWEVFL
ncbi:MAG: NADH-quinone oxidoreductase subunit NuoH [Methylohalobius crimeensis]